MDKGIYKKFNVERVDKSPKHKDCFYFVLDVTCDPYAIPAIEAYIKACKTTHPLLAEDLQKIIES